MRNDCDANKNKHYLSTKEKPMRFTVTRTDEQTGLYSEQGVSFDINGYNLKKHILF